MKQIKEIKKMINQKALDLTGVTQFEFERWCKRNKKSAYKKSVQK